MNKSLSKLFTPSISVFFAVMILFCIISWCMIPIIIAILETLATIGLFAYWRLSAASQRRQISDYLKSASFSLDAVSSQTLQIPVPAAILNLTASELIWGNDAFVQLCGASSNLFDITLASLLPDFTTDWLADSRSEYPGTVTIGTARYRVYGDMIHSGDSTSSYAAAMLYFIDSTDLLNTSDEYELSRPVVGLILVDNYDELTANLPDRAVSSFAASLDDTITAWASVSGGILRKLERNRYIFIFEQRALPAYIDGKFSVLDQVRAISNDSGAPATLSIGIGTNGSSLQENYEFASLGVEMSLSRGGDQAVLKDRYNFSFYGGRSQEKERRTKVKSRVVAGSLRELIEKAPSVYITGHKNADLDAVGAAVGVMAICRKLHKPAKIILDIEHNSSRALLQQLSKVPEYQHSFISPTDTMFPVNAESLLIVVDTNRPDQVEARNYLNTCKNVAVIDHHRRAADYIDTALLNFHEPYASSACELVTELVQNLMEKEDLLPVEIMSLLAGIVLDTKNFTVRTGSRTFEAAAWLRKNGADTVAVKLLFQNNLSATLNRYEILKHAEMYRGNIAICALDYKSDRVTAAQAADELLNIQGIECSFVCYPDDDVVMCSARSIGEVNVQMILEPFGGGGNQATAGAQIHNKTVEEVADDIRASIDDFFNM